MSQRLVRHQQLRVYAIAFESAMRLFELSAGFPTEEKYALTRQMRQASRSVCANVAEAWRKRRYEAAFVSKLNDAEAEAAETQTWIEFALRCMYLSNDTGCALLATYDEILAIIVSMINHPEQWVLPRGRLPR